MKKISKFYFEDLLYIDTRKFKGIIMPGTDLTLVGQTFQNFDGSNFSTTGVNANWKVTENSGLGIYAGVANSFDGEKTNKQSLIFDIKGSTKALSETFASSSFRIRNNIGKDSQTTTIRVMPVNGEIQINDKMKFYTTPYVEAKFDYRTDDIKLKSGFYAGVSGQINDKIGYFGEVQCYDLFGKGINPSTTGFNAGISIKI